MTSQPKGIMEDMSVLIEYRLQYTVAAVPQHLAPVPRHITPIYPTNHRRDAWAVEKGSKCPTHVGCCRPNFPVGRVTEAPTDLCKGPECTRARSRHRDFGQELDEIFGRSAKRIGVF